MGTADMEKIMGTGAVLNGMKGITAHVLLHGNTGCLCVIVEEDGEEVYQNRAFLQNREKITEMRKDMQTMLREAGRRRQWWKNITATG